MKKIPLTNGKFAIVDDDDYYRLINYKWVAVKFFADKYYARNQKHGLLSKFLLRSHPDEEFVVEFINGDTLDYRRENLQKRNSKIKPKNASAKDYEQLSFNLNDFDFFSYQKTKLKEVGVYEKTVYEAKYIDPSGRVFHFGTFDNFDEAKSSYEKNIKMIAE